MKNILITGATGQMGKVVVDTLLKKISPDRINAISRKAENLANLKEKGINTFLGSYEDVESLEKAMLGVETVLLISAGDQGDRMQEHRNVIDAAMKSGVHNIAYTSRSLQDRSTLMNTLMKDHFDTEDLIRQSGLNYIIFRNALYMEFLQYFVNKDQLDKGIFLPVGDGRVAFTFRADQAEAMANVLLNNKFDNKVYQFTSNETYSFFDIAHILTKLSGKNVRYTPVELSTFEESMKQRGLPDGAIKKMGGFLMDIKNSQEAVVGHDLEYNLGRAPLTLEKGLKLLFDL
ncbi:SDR family oxidoreductase [Mucilaginibacter gilvus]|uniref:SDR family oxidoreductase n=1 Tax=Mucilaginibacter gilvus TaxID=2305909 RepID=A0A444MI64_9SPHI|nr:SDR family oxidoreductase [Mucilaginibacter gilvus]RWY47375.1 SDR family oxidoreductase [Mucilaginibacter gilvus]